LTEIENERTRLLASALNRFSAVSFAAGIAFPFAAFIYEAFDLNYPYADTKWHAFGVAGWLALAVVLHLLARRVLGCLR
jgi:hypothetical protein